MVSPTWQDIGMLGAIAVTRTFLTYLLEKDLEKTAGGDLAGMGATAG